ncbi:MAG: HAD family hydrolase [Gammaproteobacteria bacterium]|nr:HAD family hydrolase [Gammaproteobacteria bacterium]
MALAIFDLDNTLLDGDSDYLWGQFLVRKGIVDGPSYTAENQRFLEEYEAGQLDIREFLRFQLRPLAENDPDTLADWHAEYLQDDILPVILDAGRARIAEHVERGDTLMIITATNRFITGPIATELGIPHLLATEVEFKDGRYTGNSTGTPCFRDGKVERLEEWLAEHHANLEGSWFYSDSHNDLPLLKKVTHPVAVDPDATLRRHAEQQGWEILSFRD